MVSAKEIGFYLARISNGLEGEGRSGEQFF